MALRKSTFAVSKIVASACNRRTPIFIKVALPLIHNRFAEQLWQTMKNGWVVLDMIGHGDFCLLVRLGEVSLATLDYGRL